MAPETSQFAQVARAYCNLIEQTADARPPPEWLNDVAVILPQLNAAVSVLAVDTAPAVSVAPDLDSRFELFSRLHVLLGELDAYWLEFDALGDGASGSGSLADDLTDIYCELKMGLELMGVDYAGDGERQAAANWRAGYQAHWGRHLLDAQRHLIDLAFPR
ncbi:MAG: DUF5063 domain-containing protein [Pseudomonadota bacterium]